MTMQKYNVVFSDTNTNTKRVYKGTKNTLGSGALSALQLKIVDEYGAAVSLVGLTTVAKIYIGNEGDIEVNGSTITNITAGSGTGTYRLGASDLSAPGTYQVEAYFADNASPTKIIWAGNCTITVLETITG